MTWSMYGTYLVIVLLLVLAPGPDTVITLKNTLSGGTRGGLLAICGITMGNLLQGTAAALGLGTLIMRSQPVFHTLRWLGVAYLAYLGFQALRGAWRGDYSTESLPEARVSGFRSWREGFLSNVTNPKVIAMYLSVLPQFLDPAHPDAGRALLLAFPVGVFGALWLLLLLFFIGRVRVWLARRAVRRTIDGVTGTALVGFGTALALDA